MKQIQSKKIKFP